MDRQQRGKGHEEVTKFWFMCVTAWQASASNSATTCCIKARYSPMTAAHAKSLPVSSCIEHRHRFPPHGPFSRFAVDWLGWILGFIMWHVGMLFYFFILGMMGLGRFSLLWIWKPEVEVRLIKKERGAWG